MGWAMSYLVMEAGEGGVYRLTYTCTLYRSICHLQIKLLEMHARPVL